MEDADGSIELRESGFLSDSGMSGIFGGKGAGNEMSKEFSEILREESGENQLDQGIVEEAGEDRDEQVDNLENMLKDVLDDARVDDELNTVHRFSRPILSSLPDSEEQRDDAPPLGHRGKPSSGEDTRGKASTSTASLTLKARPESTGELLLEADEPRTALCSSCSPEVKGALQSFCSVF